MAPKNRSHHQKLAIMHEQTCTSFFTYIDWNLRFYETQPKIGATRIEADDEVDCLVIGCPRQVFDAIQLNAEALFVEVATLDGERRWEPPSVGRSHYVSPHGAQDHMAKVEHILW